MVIVLTEFGMTNSYSQKKHEKEFISHPFTSLVPVPERSVNALNHRVPTVRGFLPNLGFIAVLVKGTISSFLKVLCRAELERLKHFEKGRLPNEKKQTTLRKLLSNLPHCCPCMSSANLQLTEFFSMESMSQVPQEARRVVRCFLRVFGVDKKTLSLAEVFQGTSSIRPQII
jgi:hypothetical protein